MDDWPMGLGMQSGQDKRNAPSILVHHSALHVVLCARHQLVAFNLTMSLVAQACSVLCVGHCHCQPSWAKEPLPTIYNFNFAVANVYTCACLFGVWCVAIFVHLPRS